MEIEILNLIQKLRTPLLDRIMTFVTGLGNFSSVWILLALVLILMKKTRKAGFVVLFAVLLDSLLCNLVLKNIFTRPRPCDVNTAVRLLIPRPLGYSFPSGHTSSSFAAVTALLLSGRRRLWKAALAVAVLVAFSRMYLYVHYPTDILGGIVIGILSGVIGYNIIRLILQKRNTYRKGETHE